MGVTPWSPVPTDVGAKIRSRTRDSQGVETGTFSPDTRPTAAAVEGLIGDATNDVANAIGTTIPELDWDQAAQVTALGAALLIEVSYFSEEVNSGRSPYPQLLQLYNDRLARLKLAVANDGLEEPGDEALKPAGGFHSVNPQIAFVAADVAPYGPDGFGPVNGTYGGYGPMPGSSLSAGYIPW